MDFDPLPDSVLASLLLNAVTFNTASVVALIIAAICLIVSGFISGSEISFFSLTEAQIDDMDEGSRTDNIRLLLEKPDLLLATILIANNLVNVTIVIMTNFALGPVFAGMGAVWSFILQSVILTFLILLFGEILPKLYANNYSVQWARATAGSLLFIRRLLYPISSMLVGSTTFVNKVVTKKQHNISTDELSDALDITEVQASDDKKMLEGILRFGETTASEIMTPRMQIVGVDEDSTFDEVMKVVTEMGYSRLPVYNGTMDKITGVLYSRDLLPYISSRPDAFDWRTLLRKPYYVPEQKMIDDLLEDFRKLKIHLAIVIDEFGGTQGLVTLEDVLEEIVGDINDEYDEVDHLYQRISDDSFIFEARTPLTDFFRLTGLEPEEYVEVTEDSETLAGMILSIKGDFPREKETIEYGRLRFLIITLEGRRIAKVKVRILPETETKEENGN